MIVIRKCNRLGRITAMCTTSYDTNNVARFMPNLFKDYVICCIPKISTHNYNVKNVRHLSSDNSVNSIQDLQHKVIMLNKGINNDNVNINMLTTITEDLENHDCHMPQTLSLMLLRCCGNVLYDESPKKRQALVDHVWNLVKERGKLTINHYNALLQAYIDNDHVIDPNEFLKNMTVTPGYNTYCLLLEVPTMGNCTFADNVLSKIEQSSLSIGRRICHALMYTYATSGNTDGVMKVVQLMEERNIAPLYENNIYLMYGYAKRGDIEALDKSLKNALLPPLHIMKLVRCLSLSGHGAYIPNVLSRMEPLTTGKDVVPAIIQLLHTGHVSDVCTVVSHVLDDSEFQNTKKSLIYCVLQEVINLYEDSKTILEVVNNLATKNPAIDIWKQAIELAIKENKGALALAVLHNMKATDTLIESHHFWPLFLNTQKCDSGPDIYTVLKHMVDIHVVIDPETLVNYVFSFIDTSDPGAVIIKMKEYGVAPIHSVEPFVTFLLSMGRLKESIILCTTFKKKIDCQKILDPLINSYMKSRDIDSCIHLLYQLCYNGRGFSGIFIKKLVDECQFKENNGEDLVKLLTAAKNYNAVVSDADAIYIKTKSNMSLYGQQKEVVSKLILDMTAGNTRQNYNTGLFIHPQYMNTEQLREHLDELRNRNKNVRGALRKLFMKYCNTNNAKLVQELVSEVERNNMMWTRGMRITLFDFYVKMKMIETARSVLRHILLQFPNFQIDNFKILRFVILLVENKKLSEAFDILEKCTSVNHKPDAHMQIHELFNLLIKNNYSDYLEDMINLLAAKGYCSEKYMLSRYLILAQMLNGNILTAISIFENCIKDYNKTPAKQEVLIELMKLSLESSSQYDNLLKKVSQLIVAVHGENVANVNIAIALALCNKISDLQSLLQTKVVKEELLMQQLNFLKDDEVIATTLAILEAISDQTCINVESMCQLTLSLYDKQANCKDAVELKEKMNFKGVKSSATFDKAFNSLLRTHKFQGFSDTVTNEVESNVNRMQTINK